MDREQTVTSTCVCGMFRSQGTCYHTGYKPTFTDRPLHIDIPRSVRRSLEYMRENAARWAREDKKKAEKERKK